MRLRRCLVLISFTACFCSALPETAIPGQSDASDRLKQGRHSLITRPSVLPHPKVARSEPRLNESSKPLSLVVRTRPAQER